MVSFKFLSYTTIFLLALNINLDAQTKAKGGFKVGIELKELIFGESGSFHNEPGFTLCFFGKFNLNKFSSSAIQLNAEMGFTSITKYKSIVLLNNTQENILIDQKFNLLLFEIALLPSFNFNILKDFNCEVFLGPFLSYGDKDVNYNILNNKSLEYPYMNSFGESVDFPFGINTGMTVYFKRLLLELRYKYCQFDDEGYKIDKNNVFILMGYAF